MCLCLLSVVGREPGNFEADDPNKLLNDSDGDMHKEESKMLAAWF